MAFYFPNHARASHYQHSYLTLSAVERGMVLREFIGVTYRRRFQFFKRHHFHYPQRAFKKNLQLAARRQDKKFVIARRIWQKKPQLPAYLELIFRHYVLGFVVQRLRKGYAGLLVAEDGCYPDAPLVLAALEWVADHEVALAALIAHEIEQVMAEDTRHLYLYCLQAFLVAKTLISDEALQQAIQRSRQCRVGGSVPLGAELEFSNLGYRAAFEHSFGRHHHDQPFCNFIYFHHFFLEDVSWRLGGYLDHHVRLRRYLPVPWIGGFFEYNLVRIDYPRRYSLPLTRDAGFLAHYIRRVVEFSQRVAAHSLHLNIECVQRSRQQVPEFSDYLCLLLLGGDLDRDDDGVIREQRFAQHELIKMIRQRRHFSLFDQQRHQVTEYAFLRLNAGLAAEEWLTLILALTGFNRHTDFEHYCQEALEGLQRWAHAPQAVAAADIERFVLRVRRGLEADGALDAALVEHHIHRLQRWLHCRNALLPGQ